MTLKQNVQNIALLLISSIIVIIFVEVIYSLFVRRNNKNYYIYPPNIKVYYLPSEKVFPGIKDTSFFSINGEGFRGFNLNNKAKKIYLALGGSTTECVYLDDKETWPFQLEKRLNEKLGVNSFQIINCGHSGHNSNHHIKQLGILLKKYDFVDGIIIFEGINDLQYSLSLGEKYYKKSNISYLNESFSILPDSLKPFYKNSFVYSLYKKFKNIIKRPQLALDIFGKNYIIWRKNRKNAVQIIDEIPNLSKSLSDYKNNIYKQIKLAKKFNKEIIFLSQPVMWDDNLPKYLASLCWFGWIGKDQNSNSGVYYSLAVLEKIMQKYNTILKKVCKNKNIEFIDLSYTLSKDTSVFFDDCHFNENGAKEVAKIVFNTLAKHKL